MSGLARDPMSTAARNQPETAALQQRVQQLEAQLADHNAIASRLQLQYTVAGILANAQSIELALPQVLQAIATIKEWNVALAWASVKQDLDHTAHWSAEGADTGFLATHPDLFDIHNPGSLPRRAQCSGQLIWVEDTATSTEFPVLRTASGTVLRNIVVAPLSCGQSNYGVIVLLRDFSRPFSEDFRAMYQALGNDIGRFIEATRYRVELQESHVRLSHVQRIGKIGYWEWNTETGHVFANDGAAAALQRPRKELPRTITEYLALVPEAERANVQRSLSRAIAHPNETQKFEHPLLSSAGERLTLRVHCQGRPDELGQVQRVTGSVQNVTEQRRAEKKQLANEKLWEFVFRNSPVPGVITDYTSGEFLAANDQFLRWVGMPASAIVGRTSIDIGLWHSYEERENTVKLVRTWGHLRDHEIQYVIQGELRTVLIYIEHVELGDRRCLLTKYIDITQRKKLENELNLAATAIEQAAEAIVLLDNQGRIVQANPAFTATTGYTLAQAVAEPFDELLNIPSGRHIKGLFKALTHGLRPGTPWKGELWALRKDQSVFPQLISISAIQNTSGSAYDYIVVFSDHSDRKRYEDDLKHRAMHDGLTGLPNRALLHEHLEQTLAISQRSNARMAVLFTDLDQFKQVNDDHGHDVGDSLLRQVAARLKACVRDSDLVARLGGDEFVIVLHNLAEPGDATLVAEKIVHHMGQPFPVGNLNLKVGISVGIALHPDHGTRVTHLLRYADEALYMAKNNGRNGYVLWRNASIDPPAPVEFKRKT